MSNYSFKIAYLDTDAVCIAKHDGGEFSKEEQRRLLDELNSLFPEHIKFSNDGYFPAMCVIKTKNRVYTNEKGEVKIKGSALKSSKIEPAIKAYQKRCINALLGLSEETLHHAYINACKELATLTDMKLWGGKKTISEKTVKSERTNERKLMVAMQGTEWQVGDKVFTYFTKDGNLKLVDQFNPAEPDHDLPRLLKKLFNASKVFDTVTETPRFNYGLSTNAKEYNNLMRKKVLPEKKKKPTVKNVLHDMLVMIEKKELNFVDDYADSIWKELLMDAQILIAPQPKKPRKVKDDKKSGQSGELQATEGGISEGEQPEDDAGLSDNTPF
jgi:hypothetical protein